MKTGKKAMKLVSSLSQHLALNIYNQIWFHEIGILRKCCSASVKLL